MPSREGGKSCGETAQLYMVSIKSYNLTILNIHIPKDVLALQGLVFNLGNLQLSPGSLRLAIPRTRSIRYLLSWWWSPIAPPWICVSSHLSIISWWRWRSSVVCLRVSPCFWALPEEVLSNVHGLLWYLMI